MTGCLEEEYQPALPLSESIESLAIILESQKTCEDRQIRLEQWMDSNQTKVEKYRDDFRKKCPSGKKSSYICMSNQLIASGRLELSLKGCLSNDNLNSSLRKLNEMAGIRIGSLY